jgi:hypothetical protein
MAIQIKAVNPFAMRDPIVDFFWRMRAWPYATKEEYIQYWDWRYHSISESEAVVWIATDGGAIVGHIALNFRNLRLDGRPVRAGVPGNFLVDSQYRNTMIGPLLAGSPLKSVRRNELDLLLGYGNPVAHAIFVGLGCRELGVMRSFVVVRKWDAILARRFPPARLLAPVATTAVAAWNRLSRRKPPQPAPYLEARDLGAGELLAMDRTHWAPFAGLESAGDREYLVNRFLRCPVRSYRVTGIVDKQTNRIEGIVVSDDPARMSILLCEVNGSAVSEVEAVALTIGVSPGAEIVLVPLLPHSNLGNAFQQAGFMLRSDAGSDAVLRTTTWSAYWRAEHPLASRFADTREWKLWYGWSHH